MVNDSCSSSDGGLLEFELCGDVRLSCLVNTGGDRLFAAGCLSGDRASSMFAASPFDADCVSQVVGLSRD